MYGPSLLSNDVATSSTLIHSCGTAVHKALWKIISWPVSNTDSVNSLDVVFSPFPFSSFDFLLEYALEYAVIIALLFF